MTPEDEEFNRIEMESRIKQEYIRSMNREENNRMIGAHQDHVRRLMDELAIARVCIRELGDRLSKLEKTEPVAWNLKDVTDAYKLGAKSQQRTWVGLTDEELCEIVGVSTSDSDWNVIKVQEWLRKAEAKLKEKNT